MPLQIVQGETDQYGTMRQIEIARSECYCPLEVELLAGAGHSPHREAADATLRLVAGFADRILNGHAEASDGRAA